MDFFKSFSNAAKTIAAPALLATGLAGCGFSHTTYERAPAPQRVVTVQTYTPYQAQCEVRDRYGYVIGHRPC